MTTDRSEFSDFTLARFGDLCTMVLDRYKPLWFTEAGARSGVLWRHDVDISVEQSLRVATIEADLGIFATYFFLPHSLFHNLWAPETAAMARRIVALGHRAGLHFDPKFYDEQLNASAYDDLAATERHWLENLLACEVEAVSFHHIGVLRRGPPAGDKVGGMVNAYSASITERFHYVSDSNGVWRFENLFDVVADAQHEHLHVLTHPVWWSDEPLPPRRRLQRCIDDGALAQGNWWDATSARYDRPNIDWPEGDNGK